MYLKNEIKFSKDLILIDSVYFFAYPYVIV